MEEAACFVGAKAAAEATAEQLAGDVEALTERVAEREDELSEAHAERDAALARVETLDELLDKAAADTERAAVEFEERAAAFDAERAQTREQIDALEGNVKEQLAALKQQAETVGVLTEELEREQAAVAAKSEFLEGAEEVLRLKVAIGE